MKKLYLHKNVFNFNDVKRKAKKELKDWRSLYFTTFVKENHQNRNI
jgi:hypothetical protein